MATYTPDPAAASASRPAAGEPISMAPAYRRWANSPSCHAGVRHTQSGYPGTNASGKATSPAPLPAASAMSAHALSTVASRSRNTGAAWTAATIVFSISRPPHSARARGDEQAAWPGESPRALEGRQRLADLGPRGLTFGLRQPGEHLVQGTERLALEAQALRGRCQPQGRVDAADLDVAESSVGEFGREHAGAAQAERPGLPGQRRPEVCPAPDDRHRDREEPVVFRCRVDHNGQP